MVRIDKHENGPRVYLAGKRLHHGTVGLGLTVTALKIKKLRPLALVGLAMIYHDRHDFPWTDKNNH
jgi:hypothetical protein